VQKEQDISGCVSRTAVELLASPSRAHHHMNISEGVRDVACAISAPAVADDDFHTR
jgi:hypothetical protein